MKKLTVLLSALTLLLSVSCREENIREVQFLSHALELDLNIEKRHLTASDEGKVSLIQGLNLLYLDPGASVSEFKIEANPVEFETFLSSNLPPENAGLAAKLESLDLPNSVLTLLFHHNRTESVGFKLRYEGVFDQDVENATFSNQNVGREVTGTISDRGAYLSPASYYYPRGNDELMSFELTVSLPPGWESIADGNSVARVQSEHMNLQSWKNPFKSDGLMFMAAPYVVEQAKAGDVDVYCYFFEGDTSLFETYLPATVAYVERYSELIGPYPFERFTVAENFFPTGYGMPAWTLLGQKVIQLPFIVMTSLGHEVLHNWWGNSIYVDYEDGNWCEGLTVYGADYQYKQDRSPASARAYRKDILKQYKSYINADNEFPAREFVSRHNAESRTIGYNKVMMIFHMIQEHIGEDAFFEAWKQVFEHNQGEQVTWEKWIQAYEETSGEDLSFVIPQWVDRIGAANIGVELLESQFDGTRTQVKFKVTQGPDIYNLRIPVSFSGVEEQDGVVGLNAAEAVFSFTLDGLATALELDADYDVFRHLYPQEIEPILAAVLGAEYKEFVSSQDVAGFAVLAQNMTGEEQAVSNEITQASGSKILLNPEPLPSYLADMIQVGPESISIQGREFPREGHTFVLSTELEGFSDPGLMILSNDPASLPRIGQLIPHYGKYSYLVFQGSRNVGKGQWPALESPLRVALN